MSHQGFERLIVCVDCSYSMGIDSKLDNAKKLLLGVVNSFGCDTKYFKFNCGPQELSADEFSNLEVNGGTMIEATLKELFGNHFLKWAHEGKNTKFMFVTDAEDSIKDEASVIEAKGKCVKAYGGKLDCECVLTGSGDCSSELDRIFGSNAFQHCADAEFEKVLTTTCGDINKANTISNTVLPNIEQDIQDLVNSEQKDNQQLHQDMKEIETKLKDVKAKADEAKQTIDTAKQELNALNTRTPGVISDADRAVTPDQMTAAEEAIEAQSSAYTSQYANVSNAGRLLDEASKALETEGKRADKIADDLSKKADKVSKDAAVIIANITRTIKDLTSITTGAYQQVKHLKTEFNEQLTELMAVVSKNNSLMKEFENIKNNVVASFKGIRSRNKELSDFKTEITSHIRSLNSALERLDDRW